MELNDSLFSGGCNNVAVSVLNPNGSVLTSGDTCFQGTFLFGPVVLPSTGTYTVVIAPGMNAGSADVQISLFSNQNGSITPGTPQNVTISIPGQASSSTFTGTANQSVSVSLTNSTITGGCNNAELSILNPNGSALLSGFTCYQGSLSLGPATLPATGTYTLVFAPTGANTGSATVLVTLQ